MIRALRKRHRTMFLVLTPVTALVLVLAVAGRKPMPVMDALPAEPGATTSTPKKVFEKQASFAGVNLVVQGLINGEAILDFKLAEDPQKPDLLVYWNDGGPGDSATVPQTAILLGALAGVQERRFNAPNAAKLRNGGLIFYSLPHEEVIGVMAVPAISGE